MKTKLFILILVTLFFFKYDHLKRFFAEEKYYNSLVRFHVIKKCYHIPAYPEIFAQEGLDYIRLDKQVTASSLEKLLDKNIQEKTTIPLITHHIYYASQEKEIQFPEFYLKKMEANFHRLNQINDNWQHFIWTNKPSLFNKLFNIKGVLIKDISEFKQNPLYNYLANKLKLGEDIKANFMEASDITRLLALQKFGGIYTDIDYEIYNAKALFELLTKFDFIGGRETPAKLSFYGNAFIAAKPDHPVINEAIRITENYDLYPNKTLPEHVKYPCNFYQKLYFNSPPLFTIAYLRKNNVQGNNDLILPAWMIFNFNFARNKNGDCAYLNFDPNNFNEEKLAKMIKDFENNSGNMYLEENPATQENIYYNSKYRKDFEIIGADMFCGSWVEGKKQNKKLYYWNWPFSLFLKSDEN